MSESKKLWAMHNHKTGHWLYVLATSFDKAIEAARTVEPDYSGGMIVETDYIKPDMEV